MLTDTRNFYKPFSYPFAYDFYKQQLHVHWIPEEIGMTEDVKHWATLSADERSLITSILRFFTQADISVASGYNNVFIPLFNGNPEVAMMLNTFAAMEAVHVDAYALLIDTVGMPEDLYKTFLEYQEMCDKHDYLDAIKNGAKNRQKVAEAIAAFVFGEGMQLFASFAMLMHFPANLGKMTGMGQVVTWSIRDESIHVEGMCQIFKQYVSEVKINKTKLRETVYRIAQEMVQLEDAFIDLCFKGKEDIVGLNKQDLLSYIRWIADLRLKMLGYDPIFNSTNALPWMEFITAGKEFANFFEVRSTDYTKKGFTGSWDEVFEG